MTTRWPPIPPGDLPDHRQEPREPWHIGLMITQDRAIAVAKILCPHEVADGSNCFSEVGREGQPCMICESKNAIWAARVRQVRLAMMEAFK